MKNEDLVDRVYTLRITLNAFEDDHLGQRATDIQSGVYPDDFFDAFVNDIRKPLGREHMPTGWDEPPAVDPESATGAYEDIKKRWSALKKKGNAQGVSKIVMDCIDDRFTTLAQEIGVN